VGGGKKKRKEGSDLPERVLLRFCSFYSMSSYPYFRADRREGKRGEKKKFHEEEERGREEPTSNN